MTALDLPALRTLAVPEPRHFLSRAARSLAAEARNFAGTLETTILAALPELGDFGLLEVFEGERLRCVARAHEDESLQAELATMAATRERDGADAWSPNWGGAPTLHLAAGGALGEGEPAGEQDRLLRRFASSSCIVVPLRYGGDLIGTLKLFMGRSGRKHTAEHLACAQELATIAAPIVVNSRLVEQHLKAREDLQRSEEFLRTATDAGELGLWEWDIESDRITCSERLFALHGLPPDCAIARSADFIGLVHPDDIAEVNARREAAFAGTGDYCVEFRPLRPDGRSTWLSARAQVFRDSLGKPVRMIGATIDVTSRMEMLARERGIRAEAEAARRRLELLAAASVRLSASLHPETTLAAIAEVVVPQLADWCLVDLVGADGEPDRIFSYHGDRERAAVGEAALRRLRASPETEGSLNGCFARGQSRRSQAAPADDPAESGDAALSEFARATGMRAWCVVPLVARGRRIGAIAMLQAESGRSFSDDDASMIEVLAQRSAVALDNARLFAEAEHASRQAEQARRAAEDASRAKDEFLAMLGHELRNPLAPIVTNLKLMALRDETAFRGERRVIERQVAHLSRLVDDLLDVARITRGDVRLRRQTVPLHHVVDKAIETATPLLESRRHRLELELPTASANGHAPAFHADPDRLVQVFANLLTNAARYTPDGGRIRLRADIEGDRCRISVIDNGQGIAKALLPRVFELFFQGAQGSDRANGGLGIGLALVKNLVGLHGGEVAAHSEGPGRGSTFVVTLPLLPACGPPDSEAPSTRAGALAARQRRILLVDDNRDALESLATVLELNGHDVRTASDPVSAMAVAAGFDAEFAILDIGLPGMDGYELAARLRAAGSQCRLLALTGYGRTEDQARSRACGFEQHLVKPIDPVALLNVLD
jgi:signal transduction histidine kinase/PAS domain-containing protein